VEAGSKASVVRSMGDTETQELNRLEPAYQHYTRQKCFIAFTNSAPWSDDLLSACEDVLALPEINLEPDYARKHFEPGVPLRKKALELISNSRYGIYDLSFWRDDKGVWQMPRNVFIELGMAIALNRPTLLLRHASNKELELPEYLKSLAGHIVEFSGDITLKGKLTGLVPQWINEPPDRDWWNRYCIFGNRKCEYREGNPRSKQWGKKRLVCHISDGCDPDQGDFRGVLQEVLERFSDLNVIYLDAISVAKGYDLLLCSLCQTVRSTPFAIYRVSPHTPATTFLAIGMSIALESQFRYEIPKVLLTDDLNDVPSLLSGYEVVVAKSNKERRGHLRTFIPTVIKTVRETVWKPRPLSFLDVSIAAHGESLHPMSVETKAEERLFYFDPTGELFILGKRVEPPLTPLESKALRYLYTHGGEIVSRDELVTHIWPEASKEISDQAVDALIARIRRRVEPHPSHPPRFLLTVRGRGYRLVIREDKESVPASTITDSQLVKLVSKQLGPEAANVLQGSLRFESISIGKLARALGHDYGVRKSSPRILLEAPKPEPFAFADLDRVTIVLRNLLDNAVKYSRAGSSIIITIRLAKEGTGMVEIAVQNQGLPIPVDEQEKIFEQGYRGRNAAEKRVPGIGIGLFIARRFVEDMGGRIWVESGDNQLTTFHFTLRQSK